VIFKKYPPEFYITFCSIRFY